jgi:hypothetical protein
MTKFLPAMTPEATGGEEQAKNSKAGGPIMQLPSGSGGAGGPLPTKTTNGPVYLGGQDLPSRVT